MFSFCRVMVVPPAARARPVQKIITVLVGQVPRAVPAPQNQATPHLVLLLAAAFLGMVVSTAKYVLVVG